MFQYVFVLTRRFYGMFQYVFVLTAVSLPFIFGLALACLTGNAYGLGNFQWANYFAAVLQIFLSTVCMEFNAHMCSAQFENALVGMMGYVNYW